MAKNIAIIIGSIRKHRKGHEVAGWIHDQIKPLAAKQGANINILDLAKFNLPMHDGSPAIMVKLKQQGEEGYGEEYPDERINAWSQTLRKHDAYIVVSPEYNGGFPAPLKNAMDHIYHELAGKPAMIVSYGGAGRGMSCGKQLVTLLNAFRLKVSEVQVNLEAAKRERGPDAPIDDATRDAWSVEEVHQAWDAFSKL